MTELEELRERVEKATGPDREIDLQVGFLLQGWQRMGWFYDNYEPDPSGEWVKDHNGSIYPIEPGSEYPAITESIDETLALVERKLPGWTWNIDNRRIPDHKVSVRMRLYGPGLYSAPFEEGGAVTGDWAQSFGHTAPLAILNCLLAAPLAELAREKGDRT